MAKTQAVPAGKADAVKSARLQTIYREKIVPELIEALRDELAECRAAWLREEEAHRANVRGMDETISDLRAKLAQAEQELAAIKRPCTLRRGHEIEDLEALVQHLNPRVGIAGIGFKGNGWTSCHRNKWIAWITGVLKQPPLWVLFQDEIWQPHRERWHGR